MSQFVGGRPSSLPEPHLVGTGQSALLTYEPYYGLREKPFSLSADPRFFYKTGSHAPAFEDLLAGIRRREGLVVLTGDIGTGKTTLCRAALQHLDRKTFSAFVPDPFVSREDLLKMLLIDFGVMSVDDLKSGRLNGASRPDLSYPLYEFLNSLVPLQAFAVLIIDEAQNLSLPLLEEIRILSDLEGREKLLQVVLVGQLEFLAKLRLPQMRQVDQRVSVRCALEPLSREGVAGYIMHRLEVAGGGRDRIEFSAGAFDVVYRGSGGVPRLINRICDRALHRGHLQRTTTIGSEIVWSAIADLGLDAAPAPAPVPTLAAHAPVALPEDPPKEIEQVRRGLFGKMGTRADAAPGDMDLGDLIEMPPVTPLPLGPSPAPAEDPALPLSAASSFDRVHAPSTATLGLGKPVTPESVARPERHADQADPAPLEPLLAPSPGTLGLGRAQDAYDQLRGARRRVSRPRRLSLLAAAVATVAASGIGVGLWQLQGMLQDLAASATVVYLPSPVVPSAAPGVGARSSPGAAAPAAMPSVQPAPPVASTSASASQVPGSFVIQVALFGTVERSNHLRDELIQAGYRAYQAEVTFGLRGPLQQVLVGPYPTQAEAELDRDRIRLIPGYSDARVAAVPPDKPSR